MEPLVIVIGVHGVSLGGHIAWVVIWCKLWWSYEYRVGTARFSAARSFRGRAVRRGWTGEAVW